MPSQILRQVVFDDFFLLGLGEGEEVKQSGINNASLRGKGDGVFLDLLFNGFKNIGIKTKILSDFDFFTCHTIPL